MTIYNDSVRSYHLAAAAAAASRGPQPCSQPDNNLCSVSSVTQHLNLIKRWHSARRGPNLVIDTSSVSSTTRRYTGGGPLPIQHKHDKQPGVIKHPASLAGAERGFALWAGSGVNIPQSLMGETGLGAHRPALWFYHVNVTSNENGFMGVWYSQRRVTVLYVTSTVLSHTLPCFCLMVWFAVKLMRLWPLGLLIERISLSYCVGL